MAVWQQTPNLTQISKEKPIKEKANVMGSINKRGIVNLVTASHPAKRPPRMGELRACTASRGSFHHFFLLNIPSPLP